MKHIFVKSIPFAMTVFLLNACGGGGSADTTTTTTTIGTTSLKGTVPGTRIEAFCDNDFHKEINSIDDGTAEHPFTLDLPKNTNCRIVMTTNEDDMANVVITQLKFKDEKGEESIVIRIDNDEIDLGHIPLPMSVNDIDDSNNDHVKDTPLLVNLPSDGVEIIHLEDDEYDDDHDDIVNEYDDDYDNYMPTPPPTTVPTMPSTMSNDLENWKQPRVYAKVHAQPLCNQDKVFSLRPHSTSIDSRFVDYTATPIYPEGHTLRATQVRDVNDIIPLTYDATTKTWKNDCAPITYVDKKDIYPSYWVEAVSDTNGSVVTKDRITVYDGGTDNCMACHASTSGYPLAYVNNPANLSDLEADFKTNILRVHDTHYPNAVQDYLTQLSAKGLNYNSTGLEETSKTMKVSCTDCHGINGVQGSGFKTIPSLTNAIHKVHANLSEPNIAGANNCLTCHPGETITKTFNGKIMHPLTPQWADEDGHGNWTENMGAASCTLCHGPDLRGTDITGGVNSKKGSCYSCHGQEWDSFQIGTQFITTNNGTLASIINNNEEDD